MKLIEQSFQRIFSGRISSQLWLALILVHVFGLSFIVMWNDDFFTEPAPLVVGGLVMIFVVTAILVFVTLWKLIRALGDATDADLGGVGPWMGWSIVAYLPASLISGILETGSEEGLTWLLSSIIFSFGVSLFVPILVLADGRAIQAGSPSASTTVKYWSKNFIGLFGAYLAVSLPLLIAADGLNAIVTTNQAADIGLSIASAAVAFVSTLICTGITVSAYREVEAATK